MHWSIYYCIIPPHISWPVINYTPLNKLHFNVSHFYTFHNKIWKNNLTVHCTIHCNVFQWSIVHDSSIQAEMFIFFFVLSGWKPYLNVGDHNINLYRMFTWKVNKYYINDQFHRGSYSIEYPCDTQYLILDQTVQYLILGWATD